MLAYACILVQQSSYVNAHLAFKKKQHFSLYFILSHPNPAYEHTHLVHLHACAEVGEFEVTVGVQQHVFRFDVSVDEAHGVDGIQSQHHFSCVEASPFLRHVVIHSKGHQISTCHELHHQIEVALVLK